MPAFGAQLDKANKRIGKGFKLLNFHSGSGGVRSGIGEGTSSRS
jgi:hypothetical protein